MVWYLQLCMSLAHFFGKPYGFWVTGLVSGSQALTTWSKLGLSDYLFKCLQDKAEDLRVIYKQKNSSLLNDSTFKGKKLFPF